MIEVLVYLFEEYYNGPGYPDHDTLSKKLSRAGFDEEDITDALDWLRGLADQEESSFPVAFNEGNSFRSYSASEFTKLSADARGFLAFLDGTHVLTPTLRELIIERAMAIRDDVVNLEQLKIIVLMVIWTQRGNIDALVLEELLPDGEPRVVH
jgi:Smg protein